jgi:predicted nucleic acid-binding Zn ribbon protein
MTYGVDQCRVCGVPIKPHRADEITDWLKAQKRPPIPEKEWRRRGFLAAPTKEQLSLPAAGCCQPCGEKLMINATGARQRLVMILVTAVLAITLTWTALTFAPYAGVARVTSHPER